MGVSVENQDDLSFMTASFKDTTKHMVLGVWLKMLSLRNVTL